MTHLARRFPVGWSEWSRLRCRAHLLVSIVLPHGGSVTKQSFPWRRSGSQRGNRYYVDTVGTFASSPRCGDDDQGSGAPVAAVIDL